MSALAGQTLVIASHNEGKVAEIGAMISPLRIKVISAREANVEEPEETGDSFAENAALKAIHASEHSGLPALADDSGLVIPALDGAPGIYSARWAGPDKDFAVAFARIQSELAEKGLTPSGTSAYFLCMLCLSMPQQEVRLFEGRIDGTLIFPPRGEKGFGYDPVFIPKGYDITFAEMKAGKKNNISHRAQAFSKFLTFLKQS